MARTKSWLTAVLSTRAPAAVVLIRLYVGLVFACEGVLKFLRPESLGTGRFDKAGIPAPGFFATLDGIFEIGCGVLILVGLLTRLATVPMIIDMLGALLITKLPIFWGHAPLFRGEHGWWDFIHESRVDLAQLCGSLFLLLVGAGAYSLDARIHPAPAKVIDLKSDCDAAARASWLPSWSCARAQLTHSTTVDRPTRSWSAASCLDTAVHLSHTLVTIAVGLLERSCRPSCAYWR